MNENRPEQPALIDWDPFADSATPLLDAARTSLEALHTAGRLTPVDALAVRMILDDSEAIDRSLAFCRLTGKPPAIAVVQAQQLVVELLERLKDGTTPTTEDDPLMLELQRVTEELTRVKLAKAAP